MIDAIQYLLNCLDWHTRFVYGYIEHTMSSSVPFLSVKNTVHETMWGVQYLGMWCPAAVCSVPRTFRIILPLKSLELHIQWHSVTNHNTWIFSNTTMTTSSLTEEAKLPLFLDQAQCDTQNSYEECRISNYTVLNMQQTCFCSCCLQETRLAYKQEPWVSQVLKCDIVQVEHNKIFYYVECQIIDYMFRPFLFNRPSSGHHSH